MSDYPQLGPANGGDQPQAVAGAQAGALAHNQVTITTGGGSAGGGGSSGGGGGGGGSSLVLGVGLALIATNILTQTSWPELLKKFTNSPAYYDPTSQQDKIDPSKSGFPFDAGSLWTIGGEVAAVAVLAAIAETGSTAKHAALLFEGALWLIWLLFNAGTVLPALNFFKKGSGSNDLFNLQTASGSKPLP